MAEARDVLDYLGPAGTFVGNLFGGANEEPPPQSYFRIGSGPQLALFNRLIQAAGNGSGEFGFGQAVNQGMASLRQNMLSRGITPQSGVYNSALAQMFANATSRDAGNRRNFAMQAATMQPWTTNAQNYMSTPYTDASGVRGPTEAQSRYKDNRFLQHYAPSYYDAIMTGRVG